MELRLLFVSNLFPDQHEPVRGLDNAILLNAMAQIPGTSIRVISPRPSLTRWLFQDGGSNHPRPVLRDLQFDPIFVPVRYLPKIGSLWNDGLMRRDIGTVFQQLCKDFAPHAVLTSWLYPDGCALSSLCQKENLPLVLITQGSDTHCYLKSRVRRKKILNACDSVEAVICRSGDLASQLRGTGVPSSKLSVIYNGIEDEVFFPGNRREARENLGILDDEPILLFVGNLLPVKDPSFLLRAFAGWKKEKVARAAPFGRLVLIGNGPLRKRLTREAQNLGIIDQLHFLDRRPPVEVAEWMRAADLLCLSSRNEGFPNVVLEAMASNLPVVSTDVGGISERIQDSGPEGRLVPPRDLDGFVTALTEQYDERGKTSASSGPCGRIPDGDWDSVARTYRQAMVKAIANRDARIRND